MMRAMGTVIESGPMSQVLDRDGMKDRRKALGLNQTKAAQAAGFPGGASQWSDIENGRKGNVTLDTLSKIAAALQCDARDLITPAEPKPKPARKRKTDSAADND
jgi:transcriptional regulator with XRE-family HTH domain